MFFGPSPKDPKTRTAVCAPLSRPAPGAPHTIILHPLLESGRPPFDAARSIEPRALMGVAGLWCLDPKISEGLVMLVRTSVLLCMRARDVVVVWPWCLVLSGRALSNIL